MRKDAPGPSRGFTLVELMVVVAVLALLVGLALPAFHETAARQRAAAATHAFTAQLAQARNTAITRQVAVTLCPSSGDGRCRPSTDWTDGWLLYRNPGHGEQPRGPDDILLDVRRPFGDSVRLTTSAGRLRIHYRPDGRSGGTNLTLQACAGGKLHGEIKVNRIGRVRSHPVRPPLPCPVR